MSFTHPLGNQPLGDHAVVIGAGMAGLLAARVLSESFTQVSVIERDELPVTAADRRGVPQGRHPHALLRRGAQILDELFEGMSERLAEDGAAVGDPLADIRFLFGGNRFRQASSGRRYVMCSRPFLEDHVRTAVRTLPNVATVEGADAVAVQVEAGQVTGVVVRHRDGTSAPVRADLVVDATGRGSRTPIWLSDLGYPAPREERITVDVAYTSGRFRLAPGALGSDIAIIMSAAPSNPRSGVVTAAEHGQHVVGVAATLGEHAPADLDGFRIFAGTLPFPDVRDALEGATLLSPLHTVRFPANVRRHYEELRAQPAGLLAIGDAICSFNPVYGQGMTVAAPEAMALRHLLGRGTVPTPQHWYRAVARVLGPAWGLTVGSDLRDPRVEGPRSRAGDLVGSYVARLQAAARTDAALGLAFLDVSGLVAPPSSLLRPDRVARVLLAGLHRAPAEQSRPQVPIG